MLSKRRFAVCYDPRRKVIVLHLLTFDSNAANLQTILKTMLREKQFHVVSREKYSYIAKGQSNLVHKPLKQSGGLHHNDLFSLSTSVWTGAFALYNSYLMTFFLGPLKKKSHQRLNPPKPRSQSPLTRIYRICS
jgi:hypothetical protein